jgi:type IV pilus assembly protein PilV
MKTRKQQSGVMLLEALISILIFSIGILAIIGLQAAAISASSDAKYRSDASLLANQLIGQMWVSDRTAATLQTNFQTGGAAYNSWLAVVQSTLPMVAANPPTVVVAPGVTVGNSVTITIFWKLPSGSSVHQYQTIVPII